METINNLASSASNTLFGSNSNNTKDVSGQEPIAGEQGRGTREDPYDHGNQELPKETPATHADARDGPSEAASGNDETGDRNSAQQPALQAQKEGNIPAKEQQGSKKPNEEPKESDFQSKLPHNDEEREKMMEKGEFPHDPNDHSGEPLHMHGEGGDKNKDVDDDETRAKTERSKSVAHEGGDPHGEEKKGTGEQYVKSSGLAADGGDFDASNPGAGAEANRLLEEKGIHKSEDNKGEPQNLGGAGESNDTGAPKVSKLDKIKEKLHLKH
jgi:hypothetical protein